MLRLSIWLFETNIILDVKNILWTVVGPKRKVTQLKLAGTGGLMTDIVEEKEEDSSKASSGHTPPIEKVTKSQNANHCALQWHQMKNIWTDWPLPRGSSLARFPE